MSSSVTNPADPNTLVAINDTAVDVINVQSDPWPILKDMWKFFSGNAGNIRVLSVTSNENILADLRIAEKVGAQLTVCVPTDDAVAFWGDVKEILKDRTKSPLLSKNPTYTEIAKCWVLTTRVSVHKGLPSVWSGSVDVTKDVVTTVPVVVDDVPVDSAPLDSAPLDSAPVDSAHVVSATTTTTTTPTPLLKLDDILVNSYTDIVKIDSPGTERFVLNNLMEYGLRPALIFVRWEHNPDEDLRLHAAAATLVNHGYSLVGRVGEKYLYHYNDKAFYNLSKYSVPSEKNPMVETTVAYTKMVVHKNIGKVLGLV